MYNRLCSRGGEGRGQQKENPSRVQCSRVSAGSRALQLVEYSIAASKQLSAGGKGHLAVCLRHQKVLWNCPGFPKLTVRLERAPEGTREVTMERWPHSHQNQKQDADWLEWKLGQDQSVAWNIFQCCHHADFSDTGKWLSGIRCTASRVLKDVDTNFNRWIVSCTVRFLYLKKKRCVLRGIIMCPWFTPFIILFWRGCIWQIATPGRSN